MNCLVVTGNGKKIGVRHNRIYVEQDDSKIAEFPLFKVTTLIIAGRNQLTTDAVSRLVKQGCKILYTTNHGKFKALLIGSTEFNPYIKMAQILAYQDEEKRLEIARQLANAKLQNMIAFIKRESNKKEKNKFKLCSDDIVKCIENLKTARSIHAVLGIEGIATNRYFSLFGNLLRCKIEFKGRNRRPPKDPLNTLLSLSYSLTANYITAALIKEGLLPEIGYLHAIYSNRPALSLDLLEPIRILLDKFSIKLLNLRIMKTEDFVIEDGACHLTQEGSKKFFERYSAILFGESEIISKNTCLFKIIDRQIESFKSYLRQGTKALELYRLT